MDDVDTTQLIADILREVLETRQVITTASDVAAPIHPGWVGPISWELAEYLVEAFIPPAVCQGDSAIAGAIHEAQQHRA
jgi:hypothetical protein